MGHLGASARTAKGASATRTTQEEVVEEASLLKTVKDPNATKTTLLAVLVDSYSHPPTSTTRFKTAKEASATRTTQEEDLEDLEEDFHSGNS